MIRGSITGAFVFAAALAGACQSYQPMGRPIAAAPPAVGPATAMDGNWASTDGVFVATFQGGRFTSRFTQTNEILAQGAYTVAGTNVSMQWISVQAQQQRSASCTIASADMVRCSQAGGGDFELRRSA